MCSREGFLGSNPTTPKFLPKVLVARWRRLRNAPSKGHHSRYIHFLSVYFFSIDPQKFIDGSTSSPGCSVINENPGLFKFWADPVKPWITNKGPKAAISSRGERNNLAVNFFA